jgi:choline dehydrogenase-like flavoprotein
MERARSPSTFPSARPPSLLESLRATRIGARELRTFAALADAFFPPLASSELPGDALSARDLGIAERLAALVERFPHDADRVTLRVVLGLLGSRGGAALHGRAIPFERMSSLEAEDALFRMARSERLFPRQAFKILRQLVFALGTTAREGETRSPLWSAMGYPGPTPPPDAKPRLAPVKIGRAATWTCDVVIVGSGAGGGVAAAVLAKAGLDVVVLEKGRYVPERDMTHLQHEADAAMYATRFTSDLGVTLISGSCLGGGTVVNYSTSLATPPEVRAEWDRDAGLRGVFEGSEYARSLEAVSDRIGVTTDESDPWARDRLMGEAMAKLGWKCEPLPRNVRGCAQDERCGFCNFGCRFGAKQSAMRTWLEDATSAGARLVADAEAERVLFEAGRAVGVRAHVSVGPDRATRVPLTVFGRAVVVACGALFTPVFLRKSRVEVDGIGKGLRVHPVTGVWGRFDEECDPWGGTMQARMGAEFADLDGRGYGFRFESGAVHPVEFALLQGWGGGVDVKRVLRSYRHWAPFGVLLRDRTSGTVKVRRVGPPVYDYHLGANDLAHVREGVKRAAEALVAAGARELRSVQQVAVSWRPASGEPLSSFLGRIESFGYGPCQTSYGSFHQMGGARMGSDRKTSAVGEENEVHGVPGLYVMDASCFPTASGVNPMLSIEAIAHRGARALAARFATARA